MSLTFNQNLVVIKLNEEAMLKAQNDQKARSLAQSSQSNCEFKEKVLEENWKRDPGKHKNDKETKQPTGDRKS